MHLHIKTQPDSDTLSLQNAVLCLDCEAVTNSRCDECPVCGGRALHSLVRMLGGRLLPRMAERTERNDNIVRFDLDMAIALTQIEAKDLNVVLQGITSLIGPRMGGRGASFHVNVEPVVDSRVEDEMKAA
jgi:hypothetical protein